MAGQVSTRGGLYSVNKRGDFFYMSVEKILPFKNQARKHFDDHSITELSNSIKMYGVLQPITVASIGDGEYQVISGERRLRAAKKAQLTHIPCIILEKDRPMNEIALIENIHREDLSPIEIGEVYKRLKEEGVFRSNVEIAKKLSILESIVSENIKFTYLPEEIKEVLIREKCGRTVLRKVSEAPDKEAMLAIINNTVSAKSQKKGKQLRKKLCTIYSEDGSVTLSMGKISSLNTDAKRSLRKKLLEVIKECEWRYIS